MSMENLDPLRQKPDFQQLAKQRYPDAPDEYRRCCIDGMSSIWYAHVEPLMKELEEERKSNHLLHQAMTTAESRGVQKSREELQYRIRELEEDQDKFAIGFGNWIADYVDEGFKTTSELLELYKESLLNQKP